MKTILNIRGAHCSGKTTAVRMFLSKHPNYVDEFYVGKHKTSITRLKDMNVIVLGRYDQGACGGCDRYKGGTHVKQTIMRVANMYNPEAIIYEGIMYSITFKMANEIAMMSERMGYHWKSVFLFRSYDNMLDLLQKRNNGKKVNLKSVYTKYERSIAVYEKLIQNKRDVEFENMTDKSIEYIGSIIEKRINNIMGE